VYGAIQIHIVIVKCVSRMFLFCLKEVSVFCRRVRSWLGVHSLPSSCC